MKVYLASAYSRMHEMRSVAARLTDAGHTITARWIDGKHDTPPFGMEAGSREHLSWAAQDDLVDIATCDVLVSVTGGEHRSRGGRHVEHGYALGLGKQLVILGERESVFHSLFHTDQCDTVDELIALLAFRTAIAAD